MLQERLLFWLCNTHMQRQELMPEMLLFQGLKGTAKALQYDSVANLITIQC